jgi:hypothetical protein
MAGQGANGLNLLQCGHSVTVGNDAPQATPGVLVLFLVDVDDLPGVYGRPMPQII